MSRPYPPIVFTSDADRRSLSRAQQQGQLVRLTAGVYTSDTTSELSAVVHRHLWQIVAHEMPGAVISDRSARDGGLAADGVLYVVASRTRRLELPGVSVVPRQGPGAQAGDMSLPDGIFMASEARTLLDNLVPSRFNSRGQSRTLTRQEIEK